MHPFLSAFLRLTVLVTAGIVALVVLFFLLKIVFFAALVAAVAVAVLFVVNFLRGRRRQLPTSAPR
jgi:hypothetical protein